MNLLNILFAVGWGALGATIFRVLSSGTPFPPAPLEGVPGISTFLAVAAVTGAAVLVALAVLFPERGGDVKDEPRSHA
jgi:hypothetical protein